MRLPCFCGYFAAGRANVWFCQYQTFGSANTKRLVLPIPNVCSPSAKKDQKGKNESGTDVGTWKNYFMSTTVPFALDL
jgi:hypothetical protein